jgi:hypothetical protein
MRRILFASLILASATLAAESGAELFQKALTAERAAGNLEEAIKLYQRVAKEFASDRALAAKALVQEARCYEKLGKHNAVRIYEQVARDYKDQRGPSATASARLAALRLSERAAPAGMTQRKIELPFSNRMSFSDGQRLYSWDSAAGMLAVSDLTGKGERTIFKLKAGDEGVQGVLSRDFSMIGSLLRRSGQLKLAVFKTDGTGYREINSVSPSSTCAMDWSWDNRYLFVCASDPDGKSQLVRVSVADGEVRKVRGTDSQLHRPSPDGRFIALGAMTGFGRVSIMPSQGGEPQVVADSARPIDWTRDGRYLIIDSEPSGSEALYLLPIKDGRAAGDPIFLNYGTFAFGQTTSAGSLICQNVPPGGWVETWLGSLDADGHLLGWKRLNLRDATSAGFFRWSPDSTQFSYTAWKASSPNTWAVRLRNVASGEERELYRSATRLNCIWAAQRPTLFCGAGGQQLSAISLASGRLEPVGAVGAIGALFFGSDDDRTIYLGNGHGTLIRWDAVTQQSTPVDRLPGPRPDPGEHWLARRDKDQIEIRPTAGGDWKPLISIGETQMGFTPDGKWVLYHDVDAAGKHALFRVSTAGGQPERVGDFPRVHKEGGYLFVSPDGQKVIEQGNTVPELWILENFELKQTAAR